MQLPIGIFGVAVATVTLPAVSRAAARSDMADFGRRVTAGLRLVGFLTIPATAWLVALAPQIIGLLYQRGRFSAHDTQMTAQALWCYGVGLFAYSAVKVLVPAFYALGETRIPVMASFLAVGANIALNLLLLLTPLRHRGLALSTSVTMLVNFGVLLLAMRRKVRGIEMRQTVGQLVRVALAALLFGAAAWGAAFAMGRALPHPGFPLRAAALLVSSGAGLAVFLLACAALGVEERRTVTDLFRKLARR